MFSTALSSGVDTIADFVSSSDTIQLHRSVFTALSAGALSTNAFWAGSAAHDSNDRIIYNSATGALLYDADGNGAGAAVQFATLQAGLALDHQDFFIV